MKYYFVIIALIIFPLIATSQSFTVQLAQHELTVIANSKADVELSVAATNNFTADVFLKATSETLQIPSYAFTSSTVKAPYPQKINFFYQTSEKDTGRHTIIIQGKNGPVSSTDSLFLNVLPRNDSGWKIFKELSVMPLAFAFPNSEMTIFTTAKSQFYFLGAISDGGFNYTHGWENMGTLYSTESPVLLDRNKNIWAGSSAGIGKFDGTFWTTIPLAYKMQMLRGMTLDSADNLWYWTENETAPYYVNNFYKVTDGDATRIDSVFKGIVPGMTNFRIQGLTTDRSGNIWATVFTHVTGSNLSTELYKFDGTTWTNIPYPLKSVNSSSKYVSLYGITSDNKGNIWVVYNYSPISPETGSSYLLKFDGTEWTTYKNDYLLQTAKITTDEYDNVWILSGTNLIQFNNGTFTTYNAQNAPLPLNQPGVAIGVDSYNNIWTSWGNNIAVYNPEGLQGSLVATSVQIEQSILGFRSEIFPNPTENSTTIHYSLKTESPVSISIYNSLGIEVFKSNLGFKNSGNNSEIISTSDLPSGQYYYVLKAGMQQSTQPLIIAR